MDVWREKFDIAGSNTTVDNVVPRICEKARKRKAVSTSPIHKRPSKKAKTGPAKASKQQPRLLTATTNSGNGQG